MHTAWADRLVFAGWMVALAITAFFSFRYIVRFGRQVKHNREIRMYDDPVFKRRIRALNILRYSVVAAEILVAVGGIWASELGVAQEVWFPIGVVLILALMVVGLVAERRWRRLMTKGSE